jgi:hypothetical protein
VVAADARDADDELGLRRVAPAPEREPLPAGSGGAAA